MLTQRPASTAPMHAKAEARVHCTHARRHRGQRALLPCMHADGALRCIPDAHVRTRVHADGALRCKPHAHARIHACLHAVFVALTFPGSSRSFAATSVTSRLQTTPSSRSDPGMAAFQDRV
eukprot:364689-Chlamydomonas_euryale.AAC.6